MWKKPRESRPRKNLQVELEKRNSSVKNRHEKPA
jgi:hypothetical protein